MSAAEDDLSDYSPAGISCVEPLSLSLLFWRELISLLEVLDSLLKKRGISLPSASALGWAPLSLPRSSSVARRAYHPWWNGSVLNHGIGRNRRWNIVHGNPPATGPGIGRFRALAPSFVNSGTERCHDFHLDHARSFINLKYFYFTLPLAFGKNVGFFPDWFWRQEAKTRSTPRFTAEW